MSSQEIFDQDRPRSTKARRLDEAFAGCEEWTIAPPSPRRAEALDVAPWLSTGQPDRPEDLPRAA
ncbi:MAG: hypothetical protein WD404_10640 [Solirubrobacterales bacterium]